MKKTLIILSICIMASMTGCGQNGLKNGVYESLVESDSIPISLRRLIVKSNFDTIVASYLVEDAFLPSDVNAYMGNKSLYILSLTQNADNPMQYTGVGNSEYTVWGGQTELTITLTINVLNADTVEIDILQGNIEYIHSTGMHYSKPVSLLPEKQTLTFVRELTVEDEEKMKQ